MVIYVENIEGITASQLDGFLAHWDFVPPPDTLLQILRGSSHILIALDSERREFLGYVTALSDGVACGYISFLEVRLTHRKKGIGTELMRRMLSKLQNLYGVYLGCAPALVPFYERLGFNKITSMSKRRRDV
jgi:GNAT superfamily N-acetyltransferase